MTELGPILERLGLDQYLDAFLGEGFDTWETLLDIQESDLDALNVKLGHRRKLQREIANYRGIPYERLVAGSPAQEGSSDLTKAGEGGQTPTGSSERSVVTGTETKRKYRRHPKPDENAPERPPSAYVIFSNKTREEIKGESLSFTAIAKLVGDRWQKLSPAEKEPFETQASAAKERYNIQLSTYKKTDAYKEYLQYLADFRAKHGTASDSKRPKLDKESSGGSVSVKSTEAVEIAGQQAVHKRVGSMGSMSSASFPNPLPSPGGIPLSYGMTASSAMAGTSAGRMAAPSPQTESPSSTQMAHLPRPALSSQSSVSDDSFVLRGEMSLLTTTPVTPSMPSLPPFDSSSGSESLLRASRIMHITQQESAPYPSHESYSYRPPGPSSSVYPVSTDDNWRARVTEAQFRAYPDLSRTLQPPMGMTQVAAFGSMTVPSLLMPERGAEVSQEQFQRVLPNPQLLARRDDQSDVGSLSRGGSSSGHIAGSQQGNVASLDRSESEAVSTLAGLAGTGGRVGTPRQDQRHARQ